MGCFHKASVISHHCAVSPIYNKKLFTAKTPAAADMNDRSFYQPHT